MDPMSAGAAIAIANAIKASGAIVRVEHHDFTTILSRIAEPLVVRSQGGIFTTKYHYLTAYRGLLFYSVGTMPLELPVGAEVIEAKRIWVPTMY
jgi:hypothetical protein